MPMTDFPIVDGAIAVIVAAFFLRSFFQGALKEIFSLVSIVTGFLAAGKYGAVVQSWLEGWTGESRWVEYTAYVVLFAVVWFVISLAGRAISNFVRSSVLGSWDRVGGGLLGIVKGVFVISAAVVVLDVFAPSLAPPEGGNARVMPFIREIGAYIREAATWDVEGGVEKIKKTVGAGTGGENSGGSAGSNRK